MRNASFTSKEQAELERIDDMENGRRKKKAIAAFEKRTGKKFPKIVFRLNVEALKRNSEKADSVLRSINPFYGRGCY